MKKSPINKEKIKINIIKQNTSDIKPNSNERDVFFKDD